MDKDGIILSYNGPVNQDIIEGLSSVVKEKLKYENLSMGTSLKIFSVFIEQIQNILFYSTPTTHDHNHININENELDKKHSLKNGVTIIGKNNYGFFILSGNEVTEAQKNRLEIKLEKIINLDRDGLQKLYREARKVESDEFSKGAGLGFLEMARKSSKPIQYAFKKIHDNNFFFSLNIIISN